MRGRNALQAILAGLSGGLEGQASQRAFEDERRRLEQDRLDRLGREAAASERQSVMDQVALTEKGYVEQGARADTIKRAAPALDAAVANATSVLSGAAPTRDMNTPALRAAAGQFGTPVSSVNVGGKTFELAQTPLQRAAMVAEQERGTARNEAQIERDRASREAEAAIAGQIPTIKAAFKGKISDEQARLVASGKAKPSDFITADMTPAQRAEMQLSWARLGLDREKFNFEKNQPQPGTGGQTGTAATDTFPGVTEAVTFFKSLTPEKIKNIRPTGTNAASITQANSGNWSGFLGGLATGGFVNPEETEYAEYSRTVANAVARLREKGVLSNQDITRFESQVSGVAGQNPRDMQRKIARATAWAEWLASPESSVPASQRTSTMRQPGETAAEYAARTNRGPF